VEELTQPNEAMVQFQATENEVHELRELVGDMTTKHDGLLSQVQVLEEQLDMLCAERTKEIQMIQDEEGTKQNEANLQARLCSLAEEVEQSQVTTMALKESQAEATKRTAEREVELQNHVVELEREADDDDDGSGEGALRESAVDLRVRIEDLEKERNMWRTNLVKVVRDTEGLQKDLEEMRYANENMREENQKLYAQISEEAIEDMNTKRRQLEEHLEEKNCLVTKLCNDIAALQVRELII